MPQQTIPVVDLNDFRGSDPEAREHFIETLGQALSELGFFAVSNHGIDQELIRDAYQIAEDFFSRDETTKGRYEFTELKGQRGFTSFGREHAKDSPAADLKEFWHVGRELEPGHYMGAVYGDNIWPTNGDAHPSFKPTMVDLYQQLENCAMDILRACSLYIGEDEDLIADMALAGDSILRLIHYPPIPEDRNPASMRAAAHEDINLITLLCESTGEGLELLQRDGEWLPIHALEGQIIVDAGDMMQNLTNGLLRSTTHRVVNPNNDRRRRFSMPFFVHPRGEVDLSPLPTCVHRTGGHKQFKNIGARKYLLERLREIGL